MINVRTTEFTAHVKNKKVEKLLPLDPADFGNKTTNTNSRSILTPAIGWIVAVMKSVPPALTTGRCSEQYEGGLSY